MKTVIGLFDDRNEGMRAYTALSNEGFALADLDILTNDDQDDVPKLASLRNNLPGPDAEVYLEGVRQGGTIITANVADGTATRAAEIMSNFNMVNITDRAAQFQRTNPNLVLSDPAHDQHVLEVIEEDLQVGKGEVERGRMRIYSVISEREVAQDIALRDETIRVNRRPVNRQVDIKPELFQERSFEMVEMDEIALVGKTARVVEEVVIGKEVAEKIETIKETLRRQDVEIEEVPAVRSFNEYDADFRNFYNQKLADKGVQYDELKPALNYGYSLATREPFRSSPWSAVEVDARRLWEEKNPGSWDQNKAVIHYAWEKVRSAR
jgi:uncharacterized protein (TIGR02271 family)